MSLPTPVSAKVDHPSLVPLGDTLRITSCRGNIILGLDGSNAAKELLKRVSLIQNDNSGGNDGVLYLRVMNAGGSAVYRITGGDPSKGTLAIDSVKDLREGMQVEFQYALPQAIPINFL
ncbi:hypothetical protein HK104_009419 [Borealophlyctis nickersoniae]|nr:hypothetical protein HK104_009419 [Borealophlyctis nickersoniae]